MQIINIETGQDVTHMYEGRRLTRPQSLLRLAKYRRLRPNKSKKKRKKK